MEPRELLLTAARAAAVYALMLFVIRISGKRTIGNFTAFDLLVALMLGEVVDEIIYGDVTFAQGATAIVAVAALQYANSWMSYWDHGMDRVLEGAPSIVVRNGRLDREGMRKERMNEKDVMGELRLRGVADLREVKLATVENDGALSVIREDWAEPLQRGDVDDGDHAAEDESAKYATASRRTDSPEAIG
jgi:uncharacterized membrane protein YcaP (DUF421 family)